MGNGKLQMYGNKEFNCLSVYDMNWKNIYPERCLRSWQEQKRTQTNPLSLKHAK